MSQLIPTDMLLVAQSMLPSAIACGIGVALRNSVCTEVDGITIRRIATTVTFPCLVLRTLLAPAPLPPSSIAVIVGLYGLSVMVPAILTWASTKYMHPKERGVLAGLSLGSSVDHFALPLIIGISNSLQGTAADVLIYTGCLVALLNVFTTHVLAPLYFSTAGPAFPKDFRHTDGGMYNGEWKGALKDGFGVYTYPSGATYEGEWLDGTKEGRGVYRFAKGGIYEGEWRNGKMEGVGVRTYSSGKVASGLWAEGKLVKSIDESQCALVVANANEAALCAKKVFVGGIDGEEILRSVLMQPGLLVGLAALGMRIGVGMGMMASAPQLPYGLDVVTGELAKAHGVLSLVGFGMLLDRSGVEERQMSTITRAIATRIIPGLVLYALATVAIPSALPVASICAMALATISPMSSRTLELAHVFRLNENLVAAASRFSTSVAAMCAVAVLVAARRATTTASVAEISYGLGMTSLGLWLLTSYWSESAQRARSGESDFYKRTIKMVYKGAARLHATDAAKGDTGDGGGVSGTAAAAYRPATLTVRRPACPGYRRNSGNNMRPLHCRHSRGRPHRLFIPAL